jgi:YggT family protein
VSSLGLFRSAATAKAGPLLSFHASRFQPMRALLDVIMLALQLYVWLLIASAVMSWLVAFNVVNMRNDIVRTIWNFLYQVTEPVLRPIRRILPNLGGLDISPIILLLIIFLIQGWIRDYLYPIAF